MRFRLRSITLELILLFIGVLAIAEMASIGYRYLDRSEALTALEAVRIADNISVIAALVDETPPDGRLKLLANLRNSDLPVTWAVKPWVVSDTEESEEARLLRQLLLRVLPQATEISVHFARSGAVLPPGASPPAMLWRKAGAFPEPNSKHHQRVVRGADIYGVGQAARRELAQPACCLCREY